MDARTCLFICLVALSAAGSVFGQVASICRPNERFLSCGGCQKTCKNPAPACAAVCREGCYCNDDEVRNDTGHCIKLADCPSIPARYEKTSEPRSKDDQCPPNEEYRFCEPCNRTCDNPNPICPAQCARGCFCKGDLVRDRDGRCVKYEACYLRQENDSSNFINPISYQWNCGPHQVYKECGSCDKTCSNPNPYCLAVCTRGCFCEGGFVRAPSGQCIKLTDCPRAAEVTIGSAHEPSIEDCSTDEEYLSCGWCEPSCSEPSPVCPDTACIRGCLCRPPLVRHYSGHCMELKNCLPQNCSGFNEEFVCRYGCEKRCNSRPCVERPKRCSLGCHCKLGLLRDQNEMCVTPQQCSTRLND